MMERKKAEEMLKAKVYEKDGRSQTGFRLWSNRCRLNLPAHSPDASAKPGLPRRSQSQPVAATWNKADMVGRPGSAQFDPVRPSSTKKINPKVRAVSEKSPWLPMQLKAVVESRQACRAVLSASAPPKGEAIAAEAGQTEVRARQSLAPPQIYVQIL
jgi:hypothetical protein